MEFANGVTVIDADAYDVTSVPPMTLERRSTTAGSLAEILLQENLLAAQFKLAEQLAITPKSTKSLRGPAVKPMRIQVKVKERESAVLLVEGEGGVYSWVYPQEEVSGAKRRGPQQLNFLLGDGDAAANTESRRRGLGDFFVGRLLKPIKTYVLKFAAKATIDLAVRALERDVTTGPVLVQRLDDRIEWRKNQPFEFSAAEPVKVLLLVHGTFSSTEGSFAHLDSTGAGRNFLAQACSQYDLVLGFDHKTLTATPAENAAQIVEALERMRLPEQSAVDAIAFSRGGLVYRYLAEVLLPEERPDLRLGRAVFVGCTNAGTNLAEPDNWEVMLDLYTNLVVSAIKGLSIVSGFTVGSAIATAVRMLGEFAKSIPQLAIDGGHVPGLAAMCPSGDFITQLNSRPCDLERLARYYVITSNFNPRFDADGGVRALSREMMEFLANRIGDRLFQAQNDLVVHTDSMACFGQAQARLEPASRFDFTESADVHHLRYFGQDSLVERLTSWLAFAPPALEPPPQPERIMGRDYSADRSAPLTETAGAPDWPAPTTALTRRGGPARGESNPVQIEAPLFSAEAEIATPLKRSASEPLATRAEQDAELALDVDEPVPPPAETAGPSQLADPTSPPAEVTDTWIDCHVAAEIQPYPELGTDIPLYVVLSPDQILIADHPAAARTANPVAIKRGVGLEIEVIPTANCKVQGPAIRGNIVVDPTKAETAVRFVVRGLRPGGADLLVEVRQQLSLLASLRLSPCFVEQHMQPLRLSQPLKPQLPQVARPAVMRIYEIYEANGALTLRFDLACEDPNIHLSDTQTFKPAFKVDAFVAMVFDGIEAAYGLSNKGYQHFEASLKNKASGWANELLPDSVRRTLLQYKDRIRAIQVISEESQIPWELLYIEDPKNPDDEGRFLSEWGLVRWLHNAPWPSYRLHLRPDRVRYLIPEYLDPSLKLAGAAEEQAMLKGLFPSASGIEADKLAVIEFLEKAAEDCDLLHVACHGEAAQKAVMHSELLLRGFTTPDGQLKPDALEISDVKATARMSRQDGEGTLVFLNACQTGRSGEGIAGVSGFADAFLRPLSGKGASLFIGALWSVDDTLALTFADTLYQALFDGELLIDAVKQARQACRERSDFTWLSYTVYGNPFAAIAGPDDDQSGQ